MRGGWARPPNEAHLPSCPSRGGLRESSSRPWRGEHIALTTARDDVHLHLKVFRCTARRPLLTRANRVLCISKFPRLNILNSVIKLTLVSRNRKCSYTCTRTLTRTCAEHSQIQLPPDDLLSPVNTCLSPVSTCLLSIQYPVLLNCSVVFSQLYRVHITVFT